MEIPDTSVIITTLTGLLILLLTTTPLMQRLACERAARVLLLVCYAYCVFTTILKVRMVQVNGSDFVMDVRWHTHTPTIICILPTHSAQPLHTYSQRHSPYTAHSYSHAQHTYTPPTHAQHTHTRVRHMQPHILFL